MNQDNECQPGDSLARKAARLHDELIRSLSEDNAADIAESLKQKCKEGDLAAIEIVMSYLFGEANSPIDFESGSSFEGNGDHEVAD
ncbi:MAG: hypothetical protein KatS3mg105_1036 [Gemmatales bacterium]|nr:MAG: hypothetical protein KatS3mg105_1036 [Gemmatales bacterium]